MIRRCAYVIAAIASFSVNGAIGQESADANPRGNVADHASPTTEQHLAAVKNPDLRQPPPGGNPLWGIPVSSLSVTQERPLFSASRHPPAPPRHWRRPDAGCRSSAAASRTGAASFNACGNRDRQSAKSCAHSQPDDEKLYSSPCRRSGHGLVFAFGRFADNDTREE